ncbi:hypothetical protein [Vibrio parahaemolyticus]|uniref:hypothetical protein n=1 Tax=Vibrio parahaemolyticus TaxID=670 RepID=UPI00387B236B|nr:hypothetical protein [Vibrio parahaemolyticus]HCG6030313.1 hypothetical protein [Vibrio parahaemolyticus]HCG6035092.1 hypothetical protein [Vibrio parahaemolyticus]
MTSSLSEIISKKSQPLVDKLKGYLKNNPVNIYRVGGPLTSSYFLSKSSAYAQMEMVLSMANSDLNSHEVEREDYHDLDNRLERLTLTDGTIFEISEHRILW